MFLDGGEFNLLSSLLIKSGISFLIFIFAHVTTATPKIYKSRSAYDNYNLSSIDQRRAFTPPRSMGYSAVDHVGILGITILGLIPIWMWM